MQNPDENNEAMDNYFQGGRMGEHGDYSPTPPPMPPVPSMPQMPLIPGPETIQENYYPRSRQRQRIEAVGQFLKALGNEDVWKNAPANLREKAKSMKPMLEDFRKFGNYLLREDSDAPLSPPDDDLAKKVMIEEQFQGDSVYRVKSAKHLETQIGELPDYLMPKRYEL